MAIDAFLKIDGIDGESTDQAHQAWIEVLSWSWGVSQPGQRMTTGTGLVNTGKPSFQVFTIGKRIDKASPKLFLGCATGKHIASASLDVAKVNGDGVAEEAYIHIKMSNLLVSPSRWCRSTSRRSGTSTTSWTRPELRQRSSGRTTSRAPKAAQSRNRVRPERNARARWCFGTRAGVRRLRAHSCHREPP